MVAGPISSAVAVLLLGLVLGLAVARARRRDDEAGVGGRVLGRCEVEHRCPPWFTAVLARLDLAVDPATAWPVARSTSVVGAVLVLVTVPEVVLTAAPIIAVLAAAIGVGWRVARGAGRRRPLVDATAVADALVAPLGAGASLNQAIERAVDRGDLACGPVGGLAEVRLEIEQGAGAQDAFDRWAAGSGDAGLVLVADALAVAGSSGGSQVGALLGVGDTLREREALAREVRALGSQARASAVVLAATPPAFTGAVAVADGRVASFLLGSPAGWACIVAGAAADAVGWAWMRRLTGAVS